MKPKYEVEWLDAGGIIQATIFSDYESAEHFYQLLKSGGYAALAPKVRQ